MLQLDRRLGGPEPVWKRVSRTVLHSVGSVSDLHSGTDGQTSVCRVTAVLCNELVGTWL
jgi:hypothetical protein